LHARSHNFAFRLPIIGPGETSMNECARFGLRLATGLLLLAALLLKGGTASAQKDAGKGKMTFEVYKDKGGEYRWRLKAANGKILAVPEDAYTAHADIKTAVDNVRANAGKMKVEVYQDKGKEYRWRLLATNGRGMARSSEGYATKAGAEDALDLVRAGVKDAIVLDKK